MDKNMTRLFGLLIASLFFIIFIFQAGQVLAKHNENDEDRPVSAPITSPLCKPGWGFGDKNHCHSGPNKDNHKDDHENNDNQGNNGKHGKED